MLLRIDDIVSGGKKKGKAKLPLCEVITEGITEDDAKALLPVRAGIRVTKDLALHMRWAIFYPREATPRRSTKVLRTLGDRKALHFCAKEVWAWHTDIISIWNWLTNRIV